MSNLVSITNGNLTAGTTLAVASAAAGAAQLTLTTSQALTTSFVDSAAITGNNDIVDRIVVRLGSRSASPTGTAIFTLRNTTDGVDTATVTVNVSDLNINGNGWYALKFSAPVTLTAGKSFTVRARTTSASQVNLFRDGTAGNWARLLVTTTTAAPAAADRLFIIGELTGTGTSNSFIVTMNETTTTDYGELQVSDKATLNWDTSATTRLRLSGNLQVGSGGVIQVGTSGARATTTIEFNCGSHQQYQATVLAGGTLIMYGVVRSYWRSLLNASAASGQADLTLLDNVDWVNGDTIYIPSTSQTAGQYERRTVQSVASNVVTVTSNLTNAHSIRNDGTYDTRSYVANVTRSIKMTAVGSFNSQLNIATGGTFHAEWAEYSKFIGPAVTFTVAGSFIARFCAFYNTQAQANQGLLSYNNGVSGVTFEVEDCIFAEAEGGNLSSTGSILFSVLTNIVTGYIRRGVLMGGRGAPNSSNSSFAGGGINCQSSPFEIKDCWVSSCYSAGIWWMNALTANGPMISASGCRVHSISGSFGVGMRFSTWITINSSLWQTVKYSNYGPYTISDCVVWHCINGINNTTGTQSWILPDVRLDGCEAFGCSGSNYGFGQMIEDSHPAQDCISRPGIDFVSPIGVSLSGAFDWTFYRFSILGDYSTGAIVPGALLNTVWRAKFVECNVDHTVRSKKVVFGNMDDLYVNAEISLTYGDNEDLYQRLGYQYRDTVNQHSGSACMKIVPAHATYPYESRIPVMMTAAGAEMDVTFWAKRDTSFNGAVTFKLVYGGVVLDTITPTLTTSYQQITLTVPAGAMPYKKAVELVISTTGTVDGIYVDDLERA